MITIVGAGSAGLFAAYLLAKKGFDVSVYEEHKHAGFDATLIVTSKINNALGFSSPSLNETNKTEIFSPSLHEEFEMKKDIILRKQELCKELLERAKNSGAKFFLSHSFLDFKNGEARIMNLKNKKIIKKKTDFLIGADGAFSRVAKAAGMHINKNVVEICQARIKKNVGEEKFVVWFDNATKYFFWLIPENSKNVAVGVIAEKNSRAVLNAFLKKQKMKPLHYEQGIFPLHEPFSCIEKKNIFLVGDAACQMKNTTVGGIVPGLTGAKALAEAISEGKSYKSKLCKLNKELFLHYAARKILNKFSSHDYDSLIGMMNEKTRKIFANHGRDDLSSFALKLILTQPRFLLFARKIIA